MKRKIMILTILILLFFILNSFLNFGAWAIEAPGHIVYEHKGKLWSRRPDRSEEKVLSERGATGSALYSPDGRLLVYPLGNKIFQIDLSKKKEKLLFEGAAKERIDLFSWLPALKSFMFRKQKENDIHEYYYLNLKETRIEKLKELYENPVLTRDGKYWAYTTVMPDQDGKKSQIYASKVGEEKGNFVFQGRYKDILGWNADAPVILYSMFDKIYAFNVSSRHRQIINLPFRSVVVVAYMKSGLIYYNKDQEENDSGIMIYDPQSGEQKQLIEPKKTAYLVTYNKDMTKIVFFAPDKMNDDMGHGQLYLFESKTGEAKSITRDLGRRVLLEKNMSLQWSPDGKYFVYEKLKMKFTNIKRSDIWISGEGKNERLKKRSGNPVWCVDRK